MIKLSYNIVLTSVVDYVTHKLLIIYSTLRWFIQPQVRNKTPKLCQICGCDLCIIPPYMQINLNSLRTILVTYVNKILLGDTQATVYLVLQVLYSTNIIFLYY